MGIALHPRIWLAGVCGIPPWAAAAHRRSAQRGAAQHQPDPDGGGSLTAPVTAFTYDSQGNVTRITYADSSCETWTYGTSGGSLNRPLTHTDQLGHTTTYTWDSLSRLSTVTDPLGTIVQGLSWTGTPDTKEPQLRFCPAPAGNYTVVVTASGCSSAASAVTSMDWVGWPTSSFTSMRGTSAARI